MLRQASCCRMTVRPVLISPGRPADARDVNAALLQAVESDLAELVITDVRLESDTAAQRGEVVRDDCRRGAQRKHHAIGEQFAFGFELFGKAVEDEVEVEFAGDGDVELGHGC